MKKLVSLIVVLLLLSGCSFNNKISKKEVKKDVSLEEKISEMMIIYYTGETYDDTLKDVITNVKPGGFILMSDNITNYEKTLKLVKDMQRDAKRPMIIAIDQEGGKVQRLKGLQEEVLTIPTMENIGFLNDAKFSEELGNIMGEQLKTIGVNLDFAPVIDINTNPNNKVIGSRAISSDKEVVIKNAIAISKGLGEAGVKSCFKHFPGYGDTEVDSHIDLPVINKSLEELKKEELVPFQKVIDEGADMIMVGHLHIPSISKDPASLSKEIINDLLKEEMGFKGLVITDALNMGAITKNYSEEEVYEKAINAGVDLLLMPNGSKKTVHLIKKLVDEGKISEKRIDEAYKKIIKYKNKYIKEEYLDKSYLNKDKHKNIIERNLLNGRKN